MEPAPYDAVPFLLMGALAILFRRPWARRFVSWQRFWFDRAYDEDGVAWWTAAIGVLILLMGLAILLIRETA